MVYTPQATLAASSVVADNFSLASTATSAEVQEAYYYPENNQVKLTVFAITTDENAALTLSSCGVRDTEGNEVETDESVYLLEETEIEYDALGVQSYRFFIGEQATSDITNLTGVSVLVSLANSTGSTKTGKVKVYDGTTLCGETEFSIKNEGAVWLTVDTKAHTFTESDNVSVVVE